MSLKKSLMALGVLIIAVLVGSCSDFGAPGDVVGKGNSSLSSRNSSAKKNDVSSSVSQSGVIKTSSITDREEIAKLLARFEEDKAKARTATIDPSNWHGQITVNPSGGILYHSTLIPFYGSIGTYVAQSANLKWKVYCVSQYGNAINTAEGDIPVMLIGDEAQTSFSGGVQSQPNGSLPTRSLSHVYLYGVEGSEMTYLAWGFADYQ